SLLSVVFFLLYSSPTTAIYTLSLHDALPISSWPGHFIDRNRPRFPARPSSGRPGGAPHHGRPGAPSSGCTGPTVRTAVRAPRAFVLCEPARRCVAGTPVGTAHGSSASWDAPLRPNHGVSTKPGQLQSAQGQSFGVTLRGVQRNLSR